MPETSGSTDIRAIVCTQCGASDVEMVGDDLARCKRCGANIVITKNNKGTVINEVHIHGGAAAGAVVSFKVIKAEVGADALLRDTAIHLSALEKTPVDILDSKFGVAEKKYKTLYVIKCKTTVTYSATIGNDYEEEYTVYNKFTESLETKRRTVTNWNPFSATKTDEFTIAIDEKLSMYTELVKYINDISPSSVYDADKVDFETEKPSAPTDEIIEKAKKSCGQSLAESCKSTLPGDRYRDFFETDTTDILEIKSYVLPAYSLEYEYSGKSYSSAEFGAGHRGLSCDAPDDSATAAAALDKKCIAVNAVSLGLSVLSIVLSLLVPITAVSGAALGAAFIGFIVALAIQAKFRRGIRNLNFDEKYKKLCDFLDKHALEPISGSAFELMKK